MTDSQLPEGNANLPPSTEWLETERVIEAQSEDVVKMGTPRRWLLERTGETVMWGEGKITVSFKKMADLDHDESGYRLHVGGRVGTVPEDEFEVQTPNGEAVGGVLGTVEHKATPQISPDVRCVKQENE
jgi:hypothetical protein